MYIIKTLLRKGVKIVKLRSWLNLIFYLSMVKKMHDLYKVTLSRPPLPCV